MVFSKLHCPVVEILAFIINVFQNARLKSSLFLDKLFIW